MKYLLNNNFDVNLKSSTNQTPLMMACNYGLTEIAKILIDKGCDIHSID